MTLTELSPAGRIIIHEDEVELLVKSNCSAKPPEEAWIVPNQFNLKGQEKLVCIWLIKFAFYVLFIKKVFSRNS